MQMMISLYNVLIYLQIQLNILAQTYSLLQRRRRALYLMWSDGKKTERRQFKPYLKRRFWTRPGRKGLSGWSTVNINWSHTCNLNREAWRSCVTMTTTVYQNNFSMEGGCKTIRKRYENDSVDGDRFHWGCAFLHLPGLVWGLRRNHKVAYDELAKKQRHKTTTLTTAGQTSITTCHIKFSSIFILFIESFIVITEQLDTYLFVHYFLFEQFV